MAMSMMMRTTHVFQYPLETLINPSFMGMEVDSEPFTIHGIHV
jgi:hypothetical protein